MTNTTKGEKLFHLLALLVAEVIVICFAYRLVYTRHSNPTKYNTAIPHYLTAHHLRKIFWTSFPQEPQSITTICWTVKIYCWKFPFCFQVIPSVCVISHATITSIRWYDPSWLTQSILLFGWPVGGTLNICA